MDKTGVANIYYSDADLEKQVSLSTQDMRFMQTVLKSAESVQQNPAGQLKMFIFVRRLAPKHAFLEKEI